MQVSGFTRGAKLSGQRPPNCTTRGGIRLSPRCGFSNTERLHGVRLVADISLLIWDVPTVTY